MQLLRDLSIQYDLPKKRSKNEMEDALAEQLSKPKHMSTLVKCDWFLEMLKESKLNYDSEQSFEDDDVIVTSQRFSDHEIRVMKLVQCTSRGPKQSFIKLQHGPMVPTVSESPVQPFEEYSRENRPGLEATGITDEHIVYRKPKRRWNESEESSVTNGSTCTTGVKPTQPKSASARNATIHIHDAPVWFPSSFVPA